MTGVLTLKDLQDLFWSVTVTMTNIDDTLVRHEYPSDGQPSFENGQDVVFLNITPLNDPYDKQRDITYLGEDSSSVSAEQSVFYTRVMQVHWSFYGPNSYDLADKVRSDILSESIRQVLRADEVYPLTAITAPVRAPYDFMGQWWERTDLRVAFNVATLRDSDVPYLTSATVEIENTGDPDEIITVQIEEP
jgi:hypothetical protein